MFRRVVVVGLVTLVGAACILFGVMLLHRDHPGGRDLEGMYEGYEAMGELLVGGAAIAVGGVILLPVFAFSVAMLIRSRRDSEATQHANEERAALPRAQARERDPSQ